MSGGGAGGRTWVVGDIHGCGHELGDLLERIGLGAQDRFLSVGDLFHRGPEPARVWRLLRDLPGFAAILGNHEHAMLRRAGAAGTRADASDAPGWPAALDPPPAEALLGAGGAHMAPMAPETAAEIVAAVACMPYFVRGAGAGGDWVMVHAGVPPGTRPEEARLSELVNLRHLKDLPGSPFWFEVYAGPELLLFGHKPFREPFVLRKEGRLLALGLDTGCVYGGRLTAWCVEEQRFESVPARGRYAP